MLDAGGPGEGQGVMRTVHPGPMSDNEAGFTTAGETRSLVLSPTLLFLPPPPPVSYSDSGLTSSGLDWRKDPSCET